jgi:hypothetical protein
MYKILHNKAMNAADWLDRFRGPIPYSGAMGYYFDENAARWLRERGIPVTTVEQQKSAPDINILARARALGLVLVTSDVDFEALHRQVLDGEGCTHAGIILVRPGISAGLLAERLGRLAENVEGMADVLENNLVSVG